MIWLPICTKYIQHWNVHKKFVKTLRLYLPANHRDRSGVENQEGYCFLYNISLKKPVTLFHGSFAKKRSEVNFRSILFMYLLNSKWKSFFYSTLRMTCLKLIVAQRLQKNPYWISWLWKKYCIGLLRENYEWQVNVGTNISLSLYVTAPPRHVLKVGNVVEFITFYGGGNPLALHFAKYSTIKSLFSCTK